MTKAVYEALIAIFPTDHYVLKHDPTEEAPEWASLTMTPRKSRIRVSVFGESNESLEARLKELQTKSECSEAVFRLYDDDARLDYDPIERKDSLIFTVYFV